MTDLARLQRRALYAGLAAAILSVAGALFQAGQFFRSYLIGYLFWLGIALGSLPLVMLHHLVGGTWGFVIRRILEAATRTLPVMVILFIPIIIGADHLYEWTHTDVVETDAILREKAAYLNLPFFIVRAVVYFGAWLLLARFLQTERPPCTL